MVFEPIGPGRSGAAGTGSGGVSSGDPDLVIPVVPGTYATRPPGRYPVSLAEPPPNPQADRPSIRSTSDRTAHPSWRGPSDRIRPAGSLSFRALRSIAAGLARVQPLPSIGAGECARSSRLAATAFYDAWLICWPDGSGLDLHDHGDVRSVLQVVDGVLLETYSDPGAAVGPVVRTLRSGSVTSAEPTVVHSLANRSGAVATSLHVYSPPLAGVAVDLRPADDRTEVQTVRGHRAPALTVVRP